MKTKYAPLNDKKYTGNTAKTAQQRPDVQQGKDVSYLSFGRKSPVLVPYVVHIFDAVSGVLCVCDVRQPRESLGRGAFSVLCCFCALKFVRARAGSGSVFGGQVAVPLCRACVLVPGCEWVLEAETARVR